MIVALLVISAFAFYVMTADERVRVIGPVVAFLRRMAWASVRSFARLMRYCSAVRAGNRWAIAGLVALATVAMAAGIHARYVQQLTDVRPELERLIVLEARTARDYDTAVAQFKLGATSAEALAGMITRSVMPELLASRTRIGALDRIPAEHRAVVARAEEYLRLRHESWRLRAEALQQRSMAALRRADLAERASLDAFEQVRAPER